jgi:hypothetical protein
METITISVTYNVKHFVTEDICLTECGKYINVKRGIEIKPFLRGNKKAVYVNGVATFTEELKPIKREIQCPF